MKLGRLKLVLLTGLCTATIHLSAQDENERQRNLQSLKSTEQADSTELKRAIQNYLMADSSNWDHWSKAAADLAELYHHHSEYRNPVEALLIYQEIRRRTQVRKGMSDRVLTLLKTEATLYREIREFNLPIEQDPDATRIPEDVYYRILSVHTDDEGMTRLYVSGGREDGIFAHSSGRAVSSYSIHKVSGEHLGSVKVLEHDANLSVLSFISESEEMGVAEGDLVILVALIPEIPSVFFSLQCMDIVFLNNESERVYDRRHFLFQYLPHTDTLLARYFAEQIRETYELYKDDLKGMEGWKTKFKSGRFKGKSPLNAMRTTSADDVLAFLLFVKNYPGKYMGRDWKINETYATWLQAGAPPSKDEFISDLRRAGTKKEFQRLATRYEEEIRENDYLTYVSMEADELVARGRKDEAIALNEKLLEFVNLLGTESQIGWACFSRAYIHDALKEEEESVKWYRTAITHFEKAGDYEGLGYSYSNMASFEKLNLRYTSAINYLLIALSYKEKHEEKSGYPLYKSKAISHNSIGLNYYAMGDYDSAIYQYRRSIALYEQVNTVNAKKETGLLYKQIGKCLTAKGNYRDALEIYRNQISVLEKLNARGSIADVYGDMGYAWYSLGDYRTAYRYHDSALQINLELERWDDAGFSYSSMGQMMWNLSDQDSAIACHKLALNYRELGKNERGKAYSYTKLGHLYADLSKPREAISWFEQAFDIYSELGDSIKLAELYVDIGELFQSLKDEATARTYFIPAYELVKKLNLKQETSDYAESIGISYSHDNRFEESQKFHEEAYKVRLEIGDRSGQMYSLCNLANAAWFGSFDHERAERLILQAMQLAQDLESKDIMAYCYQVHGGLKTAMGDPYTAQDLYRKALALYQETGDVRSECSIRIYLASNEINRGNFGEAARGYYEVVKIASENGQDVSKGDAFNALGEYFYLIAEYDSAFMLVDSSILLAQKNNNEWLLASAYLTKGNTYNLSGNYHQTILFYEKSDSLYQKLRSRQNQATVINNIGTIHFFQGEYLAALKCFRNVLDILDETHSEYPLKGTAMSNIGEVYLEQKLYADAMEWLGKAHEFSKGIGDYRMTNGIQALMGKCHLAQKEYEMAEPKLRSALQEYRRMKSPAGIAAIQTQLGRLYLESGKLTRASGLLDSAIGIYREIGQINSIWEPLWFRSQVYDGQNNSSLATADLKSSVESIEEMKGRLAGGGAAKKNYAQSGEKSKIYESLVNHLIAAGNVEEAFVYQEKSNVVGLIEQTRGDGNTRGARMADQDQGIELQLKMDGIYLQLLEEKKKPETSRSEEKIRKLEEMIRVAEGNYRNYLDSLVLANPAMVKQLDNIDPRTIKRSMRNMPQDLAMVEFVLSGNNLLIFVLTREKLDALTIPVKQSDVEGFVDNYYRQIIHKAEAEQVHQSAAQLYDLMILPVEEKLKGKLCLAIAPTGIFYKLPFHTLARKADGQWRYLIQDYSMVYVNDVRDVEHRELAPMDMRILAFGNTDHSLPNAEVEVGDISSLFSGTVVYVGSDATEDKAKEQMGQFPIVHFATHGVLDPVSFKNSYLTMAPNAGKNEDGHLRVEEIRGIDLFDCQLVMLSACSTAVNDDKVEGWVNNPAKEFLLSGASSVVASLWKVDDEGTRYLMKSFYSSLKAGRSKSESLRQAQIELIGNSRFTHPYYWSAFELIGYYR